MTASREQAEREKLREASQEWVLANIGPLTGWKKIPDDQKPEVDKQHVATLVGAEAPIKLQGNTFYEVTDIDIADLPLNQKKTHKLQMMVDENGNISPIWEWQRYFSRPFSFSLAPHSEYQDIVHRLQREFKLVYGEVIKGYVRGMGKRMLTLDFPRAASANDIHLEDMMTVLELAEKEGASVKITGKALERLNSPPKSHYEVEMIEKIRAKERELLQRVQQGAQQYETNASCKFRAGDLKDQSNALSAASKKLNEEIKSPAFDGDEAKVKKEMASVKSEMDNVAQTVKKISDQLSSSGLAYVDPYKDSYKDYKAAIITARENLDKIKANLKIDTDDFLLAKYAVHPSRSEEMKTEARSMAASMKTNFTDLNASIDELDKKLTEEMRPANDRVKDNMRELKNEIDNLHAEKTKLETLAAAATAATPISKDAFDAALEKLQTGISDIEQRRSKIERDIELALNLAKNKRDDAHYKFDNLTNLQTELDKHATEAAKLSNISGIDTALATAPAGTDTAAMKDRFDAMTESVKVFKNKTQEVIEKTKQLENELTATATSTSSRTIIP